MLPEYFSKLLLSKRLVAHDNSPWRATGYCNILGAAPDNLFVINVLRRI